MLLDVALADYFPLTAARIIELLGMIKRKVALLLHTLES